MHWGILTRVNLTLVIMTYKIRLLNCHRHLNKRVNFQCNKMYQTTLLIKTFTYFLKGIISQTVVLAILS